jgi:hypothetical protein
MSTSPTAGSPALGPRVIRLQSDPKLIEFEAELVDASVKFDPPLFTVNFDEILLRFLERFFRLPERFPRHYFVTDPQAGLDNFCRAATGVQRQMQESVGAPVILMTFRLLIAGGRQKKQGCGSARSIQACLR